MFKVGDIITHKDQDSYSFIVVKVNFNEYRAKVLNCNRDDIYLTDRNGNPRELIWMSKYINDNYIIDKRTNRNNKLDELGI